MIKRVENLTKFVDDYINITFKFSEGFNRGFIEKLVLV